MATLAHASLTPARIMQFAWGYTVPLIIETAVRRGLFDALDSGPKTAAELAAQAAISERGAGAVLNALAGVQLLHKDAEGRFALTPESAAFLVSTKPAFMGGLFKHTSRQLMPRWMSLNQVVETGKPVLAVNNEPDGAAFFHEFVEDIFPMSYPSAQVLAETLALARTGEPARVLDIAAGSGVWGIVLAQRYPQVRVTAVDWPGVLDVTRRVAARCGVGDRVETLAGDLADVDFGTGYRVATLGHILHSEGAARSRLLLGKVFHALAPGGNIAIAEFLVDDARATDAGGLLFAVNMLVNTEHGDTFSFSEIAAWLREAGFENVRTVDSPGPSPLILADRPH